MQESAKQARLRLIRRRHRMMMGSPPDRDYERRDHRLPNEDVEGDDQVGHDNPWLDSL